MKQTLDLQDIPRFLACPGSFLLSQKAELMFGPVETEEKDGEYVTLVPALPVDGIIEKPDMAPGEMSIQWLGSDDVTVAAIAGIMRKYDFAYEFKEFVAFNGEEGVVWTKFEFVAKAKDLQARIREALDSVDRTPNEYCETCPARAICPEFVGEVLDERLYVRIAETAESLGASLPRLKALTESTEQSVAKMLVQGTKVPGYRLGEGNRVWKDEDEASKYLKRNVKKFAATMTDRSLKPVDEVQALLESDSVELNRPTNIDRYVKIMPGAIERES